MPVNKFEAASRKSLNTSIRFGNIFSLIAFNTGAIIGTNLSPNFMSAAKPPSNNARPSLGPTFGISGNLNPPPSLP